MHVVRFRSVRTAMSFSSMFLFGMISCWLRSIPSSLKYSLHTSEIQFQLRVCDGSVLSRMWGKNQAKRHLILTICTVVNVKNTICTPFVCLTVPFAIGRMQVAQYIKIDFPSSCLSISVINHQWSRCHITGGSGDSYANNLPLTFALLIGMTIAFESWGELFSKIFRTYFSIFPIRLTFPFFLEQHSKEDETANSSNRPFNMVVCESFVFKFSPNVPCKTRLKMLSEPTIMKLFIDQQKLVFFVQGVET